MFKGGGFVKESLTGGILVAVEKTQLQLETKTYPKLLLRLQDSNGIGPYRSGRSNPLQDHASTGSLRHPMLWYENELGLLGYETLVRAHGENFRYAFPNLGAMKTWLEGVTSLQEMKACGFGIKLVKPAKFWIATEKQAIFWV
jgi:hypothetical protein